jgi:signal transduction histidine kinase
VESAATRNYATLTGVVIGVVVIAALYFGKEVLLPVTVAILLSFVLSPLVKLLRRINIPRPVAVLFSVARALATIAGIGTLVTTQVVELAADLPRYQLTIEKKADALRSATIERLSQLTTRFRSAVGQTQQGQNSVTQSPKGEPGSTADQAPIPVEVHQPSPDAPELAAKQLELLMEAFPNEKPIAALWESASAEQFESAQRIAQSLHIELRSHKLENLPFDFDEAFRAVAQDGSRMVLVRI